MIDQLRIGARMLEPDVHDDNSLLWLKHSSGEDAVLYGPKVEQLADWVARVGIQEEVWITVNDADLDGNWVAEQVPEPAGSILAFTALTTAGLIARRRRA